LKSTNFKESIDPSLFRRAGRAFDVDAAREALRGRPFKVITLLHTSGGECLNETRFVQNNLENDSLAFESSLIAYNETTEQAQNRHGGP
jgi:hypothetical protein